MIKEKTKTIWFLAYCILYSLFTIMFLVTTFCTSYKGPVIILLLPLYFFLAFTCLALWLMYISNFSKKDKFAWAWQVMSIKVWVKFFIFALFIVMALIIIITYKSCANMSEDLFTDEVLRWPIFITILIIFMIICVFFAYLLKLMNEFKTDGVIQSSKVSKIVVMIGLALMAIFIICDMVNAMTENSNSFMFALYDILSTSAKSVYNLATFKVLGFISWGLYAGYLIYTIVILFNHLKSNRVLPVKKTSSK